MINPMSLPHPLYGFLKRRINIFIFISSIFTEIYKLVCENNIRAVFVMLCDTYVMIPMRLVVKL